MCRRIAISVSLCLVALTAAAPPALGDGLPLPVDGSDQASVGSLDGQYRYAAVSNGDRTTVLRIDADGGAIDASHAIDGDLSVPLVAYDGTSSGLSADGRTLALIAPRHTFPRPTTELRILDADSLRQQEAIRLDGDFSFDAISPEGRLLYLIHYKSATDPTDYEVRSYDVTRGALLKDAIVDPDEPDEKMTGIPQARATSADGRWAYTLYGGGEEMFIHALDTTGGTAVCVDLPQFNPQQLYRLGLHVDPAGGAITVLERGLPAANVDPKTFEVSEIDPVTDDDTAPTDASPGADWLGVLAIGGGVALLAAAGLLFVRRHRRAAA